MTPLITFAGASGGGGGNVSLETQAYQIALSDYVTNRLPSDVIAFLSKGRVDKISDPILGDLFKKMLSGNAVIKDIQKMGSNQYQALSECPQGKDEYTSGQRETPICFSISNLSLRSQKPSAGDLVLLAVHAHGHQFGWELSLPAEQEHIHTMAQIFSPDVMRSVPSAPSLNISTGFYSVDTKLLICDRYLEYDQANKTLYLEQVPRRDGKYDVMRECEKGIHLVANCSFARSESDCFSMVYDAKKTAEFAGIDWSTNSFDHTWVYEKIRFLNGNFISHFFVKYTNGNNFESQDYILKFKFLGANVEIVKPEQN